MGRLSRCLAPALVVAQMSMRALVAALLIVVASPAFAGRVALKPPAAVKSTPTGYVAQKGFAVNDGKFDAGLTAQVGGVSITVPASWRFAANDPSFLATALSFLKLSPWKIAATVVGGYLLEKGISYINDNWFKKPQVGDGYYYCNVNKCFNTLQEVDAYVENEHWPHLKDRLSPAYYSDSGSTPQILKCLSDNPSFCYGAIRTGEIVGDPVPATDADLATALQTMPDPVKNGLVEVGAPLPVQDPVVNPAPQRIPASEPYTDPLTGERVRDVINVRPTPDGKYADIEPSKEVLDPATDQPKTDEQGNPENDKPEDDFCKKNPDSLACWDEGEPEDTDLEKKNQGEGVTPVSMGGSGSCPAPKTALNGKVVFSYEPLCNFAGSINPVVIALAWLAAGYILIGAFKSE